MKLTNKSWENALSLQRCIETGRDSYTKVTRSGNFSFNKEKNQRHKHRVKCLSRN